MATEMSNAATGKLKAPVESPAKKAPRPPRPNYKHIHRFPLPVIVHPLPPLIPHNPLSVISIVLSYLTYYISPPQREVFFAYFDSSTSSVHVTDPRTIRALWEMGFFGKGTLSRSEPTWLEREKKRRGLRGVDTSEEVTGKRRVERREWKLERARKEKEAIAEQLRAEEAKSGQRKGAEPPNGSITTGTITANVELGHTTQSLTEVQTAGSRQTPATLPIKDSSLASDNTSEHASAEAKPAPFSQSVDTGPLPPLTAELVPPEDSVINDEEHLQLSNEEAFFLAYGLGVLQIYNDRREAIIPTPSLLPLFRRHSYFPPLDSDTPCEPDDPFILSYAAYHHFRSLGWVVRSGVKFGVDYILYNRGPVFSHAEFAVVLLPSYSHPYWTQTEERKRRIVKKTNRTWWWLHCVNRVEAQVKKSLILCYVEVPPPSSTGADNNDIGALLKKYKIRELSIKRWVPNRSRD
ncbi:hypothetical protein VTO42DRAFT_6420 [Malbranchea cinnamomea]